MHMKARNLFPILSSVCAAALAVPAAAEAQGEAMTAASAATPAAAPAAAKPPAATGPFANVSALPFQAPDFTTITEADYLPAFTQGMAIQRAEVDAIITNPHAPTFANTIVALETSGQMLGRVARVFYALTGANTTEGLDAIDTEISPKLAAHSDAINLDPRLFARVKAVYDGRAALKLSVEENRLLERAYDQMVHAGAMLTPEQREQVKAINTALSTLTTQFAQGVRGATNNQPLIVDTRAELAGLSDADIKAAADLATAKGQPGKFAIALQNTTQQPLLPALENRATREALFQRSIHRADGQASAAHDTRQLVARIAELRARKAALFGAPDWATHAMYDRMAKTPKTALDFMQAMIPALAATQRREAAELTTAIAKDGGNYTVQPWDWARYANRIKTERFDLDEDAVAQYFQIDRVLEDGVFFAANQLYGISFKKRSDLPTYHPDVSVYTVYDKDGSELGLFYFDPYQRPSKRGGAWMSNFVEQSHLAGTKPVIYNVLNIPKAAPGETQLVSFDNVNTMFHEFGHALHGLFADQRYASISGTATARDFVEYPSQANEMWATDPAVLQNYAKHYKTGETIPLALIDKIKAAGQFNQGYEFGEALEAALLDMKWAALSPQQAAAIDSPAKVDAFEGKALQELGLEVGLVPPRYRSTYFNHVFSDPEGYSAGYYSYQWTRMLSEDSKKWFREHGGLTRANGDHYRAAVLSRGGTMDYFEMFRNFADRDPSPAALLEALGLSEAR
jgi:peptidyl-dipeptidase Dcp